MNLFRVFCLICVGVSGVACAPATKETMLDVILQQCPGVASDSKFKEQSLFNSCDDWGRISQVNSSANKKDALCLLYFHAFVQYCSHTEQPNTTVSNDVKNLDLKTVCDNLEIIPTQLDANSNLRKIIPTKDDCSKLCEDDFGFVVPLCGISYYYNQKSAVPVNHLIKVKHVDAEGHENSLTANPKSASPALGSIPERAPDNGKPDKQNENPLPHQMVPPKQNEKPTQNVVQENKNLVNQPPVPVEKTKQDVVKGQTQAQKEQNKEVESHNAAADSSKNEANQRDSSSSKPNKPITSTPTESKAKLPESNAPPPPIIDVDQNAEQEPILDKQSPNKEKNDEGDPASNNQEPMPNEDLQPNDPEDEEEPLPNVNVAQSEKSLKPKETDDESEAVNNYNTEMDGDSYFFTYFMLLCIIFIVGYVCYHNKQKILALILEGRRGKRQYRGRRPNSANYHKLDSNLEEAISSSCNKNTNNVIY